MEPVRRLNPGDDVTGELLDSWPAAIVELQRLAITSVQHPLVLQDGVLFIPSNVSQALVYVSNGTGGNLDKGAVVGLDSPGNNDPSGQFDAFIRGEVSFSGVTPATPGHCGKFAVLDQPIATSQFGQACIQGVVRVQVAFPVGTERFADITNGSTSCLTAAAAGSAGSARILWRDGSGAGTAWAYCLIGAGLDRVEGGVLDASREAPAGGGIITIDSLGQVAHGDPMHVLDTYNPKACVPTPGGIINGVHCCYVRYDSRGHLDAYQQAYPYTWFDWPSGTESDDQAGGNF